MVLNVRILTPRYCTQHNRRDTCINQVRDLIGHRLAGRPTVHIKAMRQDQPSSVFSLLRHWNLAKEEKKLSRLYRFVAHVTLHTYKSY